jgi:hypothetical protein
MAYTPDHLLFVDPGGMTGMAAYSDGTLRADEFPFHQACTQLETMMMQYSRELHVCWERFTIGPNTHKMSPQPEAYELIGVLKYLAVKYGCTVLKPALPAERLAATPKMLQAIGWWPTGKDDAQSACQHMLAWMKRNDCVPSSAATILAGL